MAKDMFLSLLPKEHTLNEKNVKIEYKMLENNAFMLILTDITRTKLLERKQEEQNQIQKMIVAVASNKNDFIDLKFYFEEFIRNPSPNLIVLLRDLHTFKGIFAQKEMLHITYSIHELESKIKSSLDKKNIIRLVNEHGLEDIFNKDLEIIASILGKEFLSITRKLTINRQAFYAVESKLKALKSENTFEKLSDILHDFEVMQYISVYNMLNEHSAAVNQMAQKLEKEISPLEIIGDKSLVVSSKFKPFMKSLMHLFNNCVDHGIEDMDIRVKKGKNAIGKIMCQFSKNEDNLQITISSDGTGIDVEKLATIAATKGITIDGEQTMLVFADYLSTKKELSIISGRGIGMSIIKSEVNKLGGNIEIKNKVGVRGKL